MTHQITDPQQLNDFMDADFALKSAEALMLEVEKLIKIANTNTSLAENALAEFDGLQDTIVMDRNNVRESIHAYTQGE